VSWKSVTSKPKKLLERERKRRVDAGHEAFRIGDELCGDRAPFVRGGLPVPGVVVDKLLLRVPEVRFQLVSGSR